MTTFFLVLMMLIAVLLILVVLIQPGKGDMLSGMGGVGGTFSNMMGSRKATDFLTKLTIGLAAALLVFSLVINKFALNRGESMVKPAVEGAVIPTDNVPATVPLEVPATPAAPAEQQPDGK